MSLICHHRSASRTSSRWAACGRPQVTHGTFGAKEAPLGLSQTLSVPRSQVNVWREKEECAACVRLAPRGKQASEQTAKCSRPRPSNRRPAPVAQRNSCAPLAHARLPPRRPAEREETWLTTAAAAIMKTSSCDFNLSPRETRPIGGRKLELVGRTPALTWRGGRAAWLAGKVCAPSGCWPAGRPIKSRCRRRREQNGLRLAQHDVGSPPASQPARPLVCLSLLIARFSSMLAPTSRRVR